MKKFYIAALLLMGVAAKGWSAVGAPQDTRGTALATIDWVGAIPCNIDSATGTIAVTCLQGRGMVYGVIASSIATSTFLTFKDTATSMAGSLAIATSAVVWGSGSESNASGAGTTQVFTFPSPIRFLKGIMIQTNTAPSGGYWTILYRPMAATE